MRPARLLAAVSLLGLMALAAVLSGVLPVEGQDDSAPAQPTGLTNTKSHDSVTLTWNDPGDSTITHYQVLRRDRAVHEIGEFITLEENTGSAGTTYTDETVEAEGSYVYRVVAVNEHGASERSSYTRADTPAHPLSGFTLVDASDQTVLATLSDGDELELESPDTGSFGIRVDVDSGAGIGSVKLELSGQSSHTETDNTAPYSLFGDGDDGLEGEALPAGGYTLTATAYSQGDGQGEELGALSVSFTIAAAEASTPDTDDDPPAEDPPAENPPAENPQQKSRSDQSKRDNKRTSITPVPPRSSPRQSSQQRVTSFALDGNNDKPTGIWGNDTTIWVANDARASSKIFAYNRSDGSRDSSQDFDTLSAAGNRDPWGLCSDGTTMFVVNEFSGKVFAYNLSTKAHDSTKDITLHADNDNAFGLWCDATTLWVLDDDNATDTKIFAYHLVADSSATPAIAYGDRDADSDFDTLAAAGNVNPRGLWSNGETMFVLDDEDYTVYAYNHSDKSQDSTKTVTFSDLNGKTPEGLWFDGRVLWVVEIGDDRAYAFDLPGARRDRTLWAATMTVGGSDDKFGYAPGLSIGALSGDEFTYGSETYTVTYIESRQDSSPHLAIWFDSEPPAGPREHWTLHAGGSAYALSSRFFALDPIAMTYFVSWANPGLTWAADDTVPVAITVSNAVPTGSPVITGTLGEGETLTADVAGISDDNVAETYFYQWIRVDGATETEIDGATDATYVPTADDAGRKLKVRVWLDDQAGFQEYPVLSAETAEVQGDPTGAPSIRGILQQDKQLTADTVGIDDPNGLTNPRWRYQWIRVDSGTESDIAGRTNSTYTLTSDDVGKQIKLRVTLTDDRSVDASLTSAATPEIVATGATTELLWVGTLTVADIHGDGDALGYGIVSGLGDLSPATFTEGDGSVAVGTLQSLFDLSTTSLVLELSPQPTPEQIQRWQLTVDESDLDLADATATPGGSFATFFTWDTTGLSIDSTTLWAANAEITVSLQSLLNLPPTGAPSIQGILEDGEELTADTVGIDDPDGLTTPNWRYQWVRIDSGTDSDITGETGSTYTLTSDDVGKQIKVKVTLTDDAMTDASLTSAATPAIVAEDAATTELLWLGTLTVADIEGLGELYGFFSERVSLGDRFGALNPDIFTEAATTHSVNYLAARFTATETLAGIDFDFQPTGEQIARWLLVLLNQELALSSAIVTGQGQSFSFDVTGQPIDDATLWEEGDQFVVSLQSLLNLPPTGASSIQGILEDGEELTADTVGIGDPDGLATPNWRYQWVRVDGGTDSDITGETGSTYTLTSDDVGKQIKVKVTLTDDGMNDASLTSAATPEIVAEDAATTELLWLAELTVDKRADNITFGYEYLVFGDFVLADLGQLSPSAFSESDTTYSISTLSTQFDASTLTALVVEPQLTTEQLAYWQLALLQSELSLATAEVIQVPGPTQLTWDVTDLPIDDATLWEEGDQFVVTLQSLLNLPPTGAPSIQGILEDGEELTADIVGIDDPDGLMTPNWRYQWVRVDAGTDSDITGETDSTYTLTSDDVGKQIKVRVTLTDDGMTDASLTSAATPAVVASDATHRLLWLGELTVGTDGNTNFGYVFVEVGGVPIIDHGRLIPDAFVEGETTYSIDYLAHEFGDPTRFAIGLTTPAMNVVDHWRLALLGTELELASGVANPFPGASSLTLYAWESPGLPIDDATLWEVGDKHVVLLQEVLNYDPTGAPSIQGILEDGETLTADTVGIADPDGLDDPRWTYQWLADGVAIAMATNSTYELTAAEVGKAISLTVGFTDDRDNVESLTSAATPAVVADGAATRKLLWLGELTVGAGGWGSGHASVGLGGTDTATFGELSPSAFTESGTIYSIQNLVNVPLGTSSSLGFLLAPVTTPTQIADWRLVLLEAELAVKSASALETLPSNPGIQYVWAIDDTTPWEVDDQFLVMLQEAFNIPATGVPTISQPSDDTTPETDEVLTAGVADIADANGFDPADFEYQWFRGTTEIQDATGSTYTLSPADVGHNITVQVSFTDGDGFAEAVTSAAVGPVQFAPGLIFTLANSASAPPVTKLSVPEGETVTYYVRLTIEPTVEVSFNLSASTPDISLNESSLDFDAMDWDTPQAVGVFGVPDSGATDETPHVTHRFSADSAEYANLSSLLPVRVLDDEPVPVAITADESSVAEGVETGFTLTRNAHTDEELTVHVAVEEPGQAGGPPAAVTFAQGESTATFNATPLQDEVVEGESELTVTVVEVVSGQTEYTTGASATIPVTDDDTAALEFSVDTPAIAEADAGAVTLTIEITNAKTFARPQTFDLTLGGTATVGSDYTFADSEGRPLTKPWTIVLPAGASSVEATITAVDDAADDDAETITIGASHDGAVFGGGQVITVTITDDDEAGTLALTGLTISTTNSRSAYPAFNAGTGHYAVGCASGDTVTITPSAATGTRIAVGGEQVLSGGAATLTGLDPNADIRIALSNSSGESRSYTVHCLPDDFPIVTATANGSSWDGLILSSLDQASYGFLHVLDANGVPRFQRRIPPAGATSAEAVNVRHFRPFADGFHPFGYAALTMDERSLVLLDDEFTEGQRISETSLRSRTGLSDARLDAHDFLNLPDGNSLVVIDDPVSRPASQIGFGNYQFPQLMVDEVLYRVSRSGAATRLWHAFDEMALEDCTQHQFTGNQSWSHFNSIELLPDGGYLLSFRGCSQVVEISDTGETLWRVGRSNLDDAQWQARPTGKSRVAPYVIIGDPEGEFCGQHSAKLIGNGNLLLYDNGVDCLENHEDGTTTRTSGEYSRVVEYALDHERGEATFLRDHSLGGTEAFLTQAIGLVAPVDNGHWLVSWGRSDDDTSTTPSITEVNPETNAELLDIRYENAGGTRLVTRSYPVREEQLPALAEPDPGPLRAWFPPSPSTSIFNEGPGDPPTVVVAFSRPIVDPQVDEDGDHPSFFIQGSPTIASITPLVAAGEPANAYLITFSQQRKSNFAIRINKNVGCDAGGICTLDGTKLSEAPSQMWLVESPASVEFAQAEYDVDEGGSIDVTLRLSKAHGSVRPIEIPVTVAKSATMTHGYVVSTEVVRFPAGEAGRTQTVKVTIPPDALDNDDEYLTLSIGDGSLVTGNDIGSDGVKVGGNATTQVDIRDDDWPHVEVWFDAASHSVGEGESIEITASLSAPPERPVAIEFRGVFNGGISFGDYDVGSTIAFGAGDTSGSATFTATQDTIDDDGESVTLRFVNADLPERITRREGQHETTVAINDDDVPWVEVSFEHNSYLVAESLSESIRVTLSADPERIVVIPLTITDQGGAVSGTSTTGDYYPALPTSLTFQSGVTEQTIPFTARHDGDDDDNESVKIEIGDLAGLERVTRGSHGVTTIQIVDDVDDVPIVAVTFGDAISTVREGAALTLTLSLVDPDNPTQPKDAKRPLTIPVRFTPIGGDPADQDDVAAISPVTFQSGQTSRQVRVEVLQDQSDEPNEQFRLELGALPTRTRQGVNPGRTITIIDNNVTANLTVSANSVTEGDGQDLTVTVTLNELPLDPLTLRVGAHPDSEADSGDYGGLPATLSFPNAFTDPSLDPNADLMRSFTLTITDDTTVDDTETLTLTLLNPPGTVVPGPAAEQTITIFDNDVPEVEVFFEQEEYTAAEGSGVDVRLLLSADP